VPSERSSAGHRFYGQADVERLYQILLFKELGIPLEGIAQLIDDPAIDQISALRAQRELLVEKRRRVSQVIRALDQALKTMDQGGSMSKEEMAGGFKAMANAPEEVRDHYAKHQQETVDQWGGGDSYKESMRRAKTYSKDDWKRIKAEGAAAETHMAELMKTGADPKGEEARAGAEIMRQHISRRYYPCSHKMHAGLAEMYQADSRFKAHYEDRAQGLAAFVASAIRANAIDQLGLG